MGGLFIFFDHKKGSSPQELSLVWVAHRHMDGLQINDEQKF